MPFDFAWDFRDTVPFVTDPAFATAADGNVFAYPHTYTNGNGLTINGGYSAAGMGSLNEAATNDPRIAGVNYRSNVGVPIDFHVDLGSGSAPGAGTYQIDLAVGRPTAGATADFKLLDNATVLIDGTNGGAGFATAAGHFIDATLTDVTASSSWTGTKITSTFATTTVLLRAGVDNIGSFTMLSHFRLILSTGGVSSFGSMGMLTLMGVGM